MTCSHPPQNFEVGHFTLLFFSELDSNVPKFITQIAIAIAIVLLIKSIFEMLSLVSLWFIMNNFDVLVN